MPRNIRAVETKTNGAEDIETLAAKARQARMEKCGQAINKVLEEYNCTMAVYLKLGNEHVPIQALITVPAVIVPMSK